MAYDDAEIERIKAAIPRDFQPTADSRGRLANRFLSVDSLRESTPLQGSATDHIAADALERHNLAADFIADLASDPDITNPNFLLPGAQALAQARAHERTEQEERDALDMRLALVRDELGRQLARLNAELAAIDARLEEIRLRREAIGTEMEAVDDLEQLAREGRLDPNNPTHRALLIKAGIDPERLNGQSIAELIAQRRRDLTTEDGTLEGEWNAKMKRRGQVIIERGEVIVAQREIESADTDEARLLAERRARTVLGAQQLGEAAYGSSSGQARVIAAEAVGRSADSEAYNRMAVTKGDAQLNASGAGFELDGGPPGRLPTPP